MQNCTRSAGRHDGRWDHAIHYSAMLACILSVGGSLMIVMSYLLIRPIRTKVREILVQLSVMDLTYSLANLIGLFINYPRHYKPGPGACDLMDPYAVVCLVQGGVAFYATISSILWTGGIAVYVYYRVVINRDRMVRYVVMALYLVCWGIPALLLLWVMLIGAVGYDSESSGGWCSLMQNSQSSYRGNVIVQLLNNDLWVVMTILIVVLLYAITHCHIKHQLQSMRSRQASGEVLSELQRTDTKLLCIPVMFVGLRLWDLTVSVPRVYLRQTLPHPLGVVFTLLSAVGDSSQGFFNCLLFCVFTPRVRQYFLQWARCRRGNTMEEQPLLNSSNWSLSSPRSNTQHPIINNDST